MAVYVDALMSYADKQIADAAKRHGRQWCHLIGDDVEELHRFAQSIGLRRSWFQGNSSMPHYDLTPGKRQQAIKKGAIEIDRDEFVSRLRAYRAS